jgi:4'-phosphopantetheinyl transferase
MAGETSTDAHSVRFEGASGARPPLADGEVHVLAVDLDQPPEPFLELLSPAEQERAERFHFDLHRRRYIVSHGALRCILAQELGVEPAVLQFREAERGKPELPAYPELQFNLSHSAACALVAMTRLSPVGVDVEERRPMEYAARITRRYFSPAEIAVFDTLPESQHLAAFYRCWTRKEAYLKATGEGLALPLVGFDVTLGPDEPARFLRVGEHSGQESGWLLFDLTPPGNHAAALALRHTGAKVLAWNWRPDPTRR